MNASSASFSPWEYRNIALAGVAQSAALVHGLATYGTVSESDVLAIINPLLVLTPDSVAEVYPNLSHLSTGLKSLQDMFNPARVRDHADIVRYTLGMLILRNKLERSKARQQQIRARLQDMPPLQLHSYQSEDEADLAREQELEAQRESTFEQIAALYQDTISTLPYRIQVQGKIELLKDKHIANRIRALLLAGIRSAVLWHQLGGRRWHLMFYRKRIQASAATIRRKLIVSV